MFNARTQTALDAISARTGKTLTAFQNAIVDFVVSGSGHGIVKAVPGSGKSTTLEMCVIGLTAVAPSVRGVVLAFNKAIADSMRARLNSSSWDVKTLNGLGHGVLMRDPRFKGANLDTKKTDTLFRAVVGYDQLPTDQRFEMDAASYGICKLVSLFRSFAVGTVANPLPVSDQYIQDLMDRFDVETPESMPFDRFRDLLLATFERVVNCTRVIDFDDQLYMPIRYCMSFPTWYQFVFVDESQDLNMIQLEMIKRLTGGRTRALFVGDEWQAIYGFRGAASDAMQICESTFKATALPLSICWRCPVAVVNVAATINPDILPAPNAAKGRVEDIKKDDFIKKATDGDAVLCRTTAPLVETAFNFIREGKKAYVKGSDIGAGLRALLQKIGKRRGDAAIYKKIQDYKNEQIDKCNNEEKLAKMIDRLDTLLILAEDCETAAQVTAKIVDIFAENKPGICCSTVHKAKGLEFRTVYLIHPELMPHPMAKTPEAYRQELNLKYVAITRAMENLYTVTGMGKAKSKGRKRTAKTAAAEVA